MMTNPASAAYRLRSVKMPHFQAPSAGAGHVAGHEMLWSIRYYNPALLPKDQLKWVAR
ncbi:hypothetical protein [Paracoccus salsus]|uniref:hypothetical protein n=1 Tax=Paracoccus salsus TaxID=2911061 RepID=UPI001F3B49D9|nr:hypothetical protein [Paracoccus salsus]MCF3972236.1 hypothetical protein [Paracoccus salsus]